jgi:tripartite-type tricarboxylate transporter receptor subunit TctC
MTVGLFFTPMAYGAEYPSRTIQIIVPVTPGGPTDTTARIMSNRLGELLGQRIVVVNKTGGGQAIGIQAVLAEPPDGHTILDATNSIVVLPHISKQLDFSHPGRL